MGRGAKVAALLESVRASDAKDFEIVVVDQSSDDETSEAVAPFLADLRFRYVHSEIPGASRARNLGMTLTTAPYIVITDDDCIVPRNWLATITRPFEEEPRVGVVFCSVQPVPAVGPGLTPSVVFKRNRILDSTTKAWISARKGLALGAGMAIRREMLKDVPGFDERLGPGAKFGAAEDNDFSWRGLLNGWWTFQSADISVLHDGFRPMEEVRSLLMRDFYGVGGASAKYLRSGKWPIVFFLGSWILRFGVIDPGRDLLSGRRPKGFRRPYMLLLGLCDGLRMPFNRADLTYQAADEAEA